MTIESNSAAIGVSHGLGRQVLRHPRLFNTISTTVGPSETSHLSIKNARTTQTDNPRENRSSISIVIGTTTRVANHSDQEMRIICCTGIDRMPTSIHRRLMPKCRIPVGIVAEDIDS
jgi:hypothetical protein